jgi:hypothetical protein
VHPTTGLLLAANNLSDLVTPATARTNLGLGTAAVAAIDTTAADIVALGAQAAGATGKVADAGHTHPTTGVLLVANNLSDVTASTARINLGLGTAAVAAIDTTAADIAAIGTAAGAGAVGKVADSGHVHAGVASLTAGSGISITGGSGGKGALTVASTVAAALLASVEYNPASGVAKTTTSGTWVALDTTNLTASFTAPASGRVLVRLTANGRISSSSANLFWGLVTHSTTTQVGDALNVTQNTLAGTIAAAMILSGLTPSTVYNLDWAFAVAGTGTGSVFYGGGTTINAGSTGPAIIEVWAA